MTDPVAPACRAAIRDANAAWPTRNKRNNGLLGDLSHQARKSDHNTGLAVDITHDPDSGCDGNVIAEAALRDLRTAYVIWNRRIANPYIQEGAWRPYAGANGHTHHVHISVREAARNDDSPWGWAP